MNSLNLYYSHIKNPLASSQIKSDKLVLVVHPPVFTLNVCSCTHSQVAESIVLFFFITRYYFIVRELFSMREHAYIEAGARGPPLSYKNVGGHHA